MLFHTYGKCPLFYVGDAIDYFSHWEFYKSVDSFVSSLQAVIEKVPLKQTIFSEIEKACPPHCILATNTSTIDLNVVGEKTSSQDRIVGAHFFRFIFLDHQNIFKDLIVLLLSLEAKDVKDLQISKSERM